MPRFALLHCLLFVLPNSNRTSAQYGTASGNCNRQRQGFRRRDREIVALMPPLFLSILVSYFPSKQSCCETLEQWSAIPCLHFCAVYCCKTFRYFIWQLFESIMTPTETWDQSSYKQSLVLVLPEVPKSYVIIASGANAECHRRVSLPTFQRCLHTVGFCNTWFPAPATFRTEIG